MFRLRIKTDDAAINQDPSLEVSTILHEVAAKVEQGYRDGYIMDSNGNSVGSWKFTQRRSRKISVYGKA